MKIESDYQRPASLSQLLGELNTVRSNPASEVVKSARIAIVMGEWHGYITDKLLEGAIQCLQEHGVEKASITYVGVPGAYEIPVAVNQLARSGNVDGVITLGAVIRGGTPHFDYVAGECVRGMTDVSLATGVPVAFGVLTVDNMDQAVERSHVDNKGRESAMALLHMIDVLSQLSS